MLTECERRLGANGSRLRGQVYWLFPDPACWAAREILYHIFSVKGASEDLHLFDTVPRRPLAYGVDASWVPGYCTLNLTCIASRPGSVKRFFKISLKCHQNLDDSARQHGTRAVLPHFGRPLPSRESFLRGHDARDDSTGPSAYSKV